LDENQQASDNANSQANRSNAPTVNLQVDLAVQRTELALDRTQLAWVRTAFTFITAGLAIDKGTQALHEARLLAHTNWVAGSHAVCVALASASTLFLLISSVLYFQQARALARLKGAEQPRILLTLLISCLVVLLGVTLSIFMLMWQ
jgi:putative membrane protein